MKNINIKSLIFIAGVLLLSPLVAQPKDACLTRTDPGYPKEEILVPYGKAADFSLTDRIQINQADNRICMVNEKCYIARGDYLEIFRIGTTNIFILTQKDSREKLVNSVRLRLTSYLDRPDFLAGKDLDGTEYFLMYLGLGTHSNKIYRLETFPKNNSTGFTRPSDENANWTATCQNALQGGSGNGVDPPDFP